MKIPIPTLSCILNHNFFCHAILHLKTISESYNDQEKKEETEGEDEEERKREESER